MPINSIPDGTYRIRQAGAKSEVANMIANGKKCHYVQIGIELFRFDNFEDAREFVADKDLVADTMSLDFGMKAEPADDGSAMDSAVDDDSASDNEAAGEDQSVDSQDNDENVDESAEA